MSAPSTTTEPVDLVDTVNGAALLAGTANVIMQLAVPGVGHGVVESRVESGRVFDHPIKRTRTTVSYLSVVVMGTDEEREAYRRAVDSAHRQVFSTEESPVKYHAMNPDLQLWVAACLYRGFEDTYQAFNGPQTDAFLDHVYGEASPIGTTLQVRESMWPATREDFWKYWDDMLAQVHIDDVVREYLRALTRLEFLPRPVSFLFGGFSQFVTTGFLPQRFRDEMRFPWSERRQRRFDQLTRTVGFVTRHLPRFLREVPFNLYLRDLRFRIKHDLRIV